MAVSGGIVLASFDGTTGAGADIFGSDLTFTDVPGGMGRRLRIEIGFRTGVAGQWSLRINSFDYLLSNGSNINGLFEKDFLLLNTDSLNVRSENANGAFVRIFAV